ncbi:18S rRNA pseudouridine methyltransferase [Psilocybe cubensis]|uniref:Nucleolar essential protein 1 n=2 Tax=Psilocybe cubensis TaxID=181762 RepID=A0A8H7Y1C7_PSICU|nr:18S rRNA pseudouridine methyltransferase [Psilocybe cubensis]KAH9483129.1 18S rRNA pseudouridine methyltransferase [Psilocybe cubensis]
MEAPTATVPARRRRHSGSMDNSHAEGIPNINKILGTDNGPIEPPPRPKSTPGERPTQRRRQKSPVRSEERKQGDDDGEEQENGPVMQIDDESRANPKPSTATPITILKNTHNHTTTAVERPTRPLPSSKSRKMASTATPLNPHAPIHHPANPLMLPVQAQVPRGAAATTQRRLFVILEQACLEAYKVSGGSSGAKGRGGKEGGEAKYTLLNCDDHQGILAKTGRDIADARPDITHQCLLTLLDSPLNKAGLLQVYIHTARGVLIEVNPHVRIPRTFKRFSGLMVQLLHKLSIRGVNGPEKLLKVVKNPVTDHLPPNTVKLTLSCDAPTQRLSKYLPTLPTTHNIAVFVGAMARGKDDFADAYVDEKIGISAYPLSASVACGKFCCALEELWDIV